MKKRIITDCKLAREFNSAGDLLWKYCNQGRKLATLKANEEELIIFPDKANTLLSSWQGPFQVIKRSSPVNYVVDVRGQINFFTLICWKNTSLSSVTMWQCFDKIILCGNGKCDITDWWHRWWWVWGRNIISGFELKRALVWRSCCWQFTDNISEYYHTNISHIQTYWLTFLVWKQQQHMWLLFPTTNISKSDRRIFHYILRTQ